MSSYQPPAIDMKQTSQNAAQVAEEGCSWYKQLNGEELHPACELHRQACCVMLLLHMTCIIAHVQANVSANQRGGACPAEISP